jgi:hypothetical protein
MAEIRVKVPDKCKKKLVEMADSSRRWYGQQLEVLIDEAYERFKEGTTEKNV